MTEDVRAALCALDRPSWREIEPALEAVYGLGARIFPEALTVYPTLRGWRDRAALVFAALSFAKSDGDAVRLGVMALDDKSGRVRAHACMLLGLSRRKDVVPALEALLSHRSGETRDHAARAIDDIRSGRKRV